MAATEHIPLSAVNTAQRGLPRPVATAPDGKLRPVPWTQQDTEWGQIHDRRWFEARDHGLCLVCGLVVDDGEIIWVVQSDEARPPLPTLDPPPSATPVTCRDFSERVADSAPMHKTCALLTRSHCAHMRKGIHAGEFVRCPYRREE